jgi:hypothetical protein
VQALDRYAYANNNPVRFSDPTGHMAWEGDGGGCSEIIKCIKEKQSQVIAQSRTAERKCADGNPNYCSGWSNGSARPMIGVHYGGGDTMDFIYGGYAYDQTDYVFDFKSGTLFVMKTTGEGTYVGTPNGASVEGYVGITNVYGIPSSATSDQVSDLLAGSNIDSSLDAGLEIIPDIDTSVGKGLSIDLDPLTGKPMITSAGPMYSTEKKIGIGASIIPTGIDLGVQGGYSQTVVSPNYYQLRFWPFR